MKIYVVFGERGEYSDWKTWPVKAFEDDVAAKNFVLACDAQLKDLSQYKGCQLSGQTKKEMGNNHE